jgi:uncharacterized protein YegL
MFERQEGSPDMTKLDVAKKCLQTLTDQLKTSDQFGLVTFNHEAVVSSPMKAWSSVNKSQLKREIGLLRAHGLTCLTAAIDCATDMFNTPFEHANSTSRVIFLTDLCSTVDSVNDEKRLLSTIKQNADRGIYTTVVGIGMDLNVRLVEEISKTPGAKYCSVDSAHEFQQIMNMEFDYDVTILAFDIKVELQSQDYQLVKGYGSPELNAVKPGRPVKISSEFPCSQNELGESKGGMMLFKIQPKKSRKKPGNEIKVCVSWREASGSTHEQVITLNLKDCFEDAGTRKAVLLVHYVDLHNDYVHDRRHNKIKFLEMFQSFRDHFVRELDEMGDTSYTTFNKGDLELVDKIIELEEHPEGSSDPEPGPSGSSGSSWNSVSTLLWSGVQVPSVQFCQPNPPSRKGKTVKRLSKPRRKQVRCSARQLPQASTVRQAAKSQSQSSSPQIPQQGRKKQRVDSDTKVAVVGTRRSPRFTNSEPVVGQSASDTAPATRKRKMAAPVLSGPGVI